MSGKIVVVTGPMFSEKSGEIVGRCIKEQSYGRKKVIAFKPSKDTRSSSKIVSRVGIEFPAMLLESKLTTKSCEDILAICKDFNVVAFDEAQFFSQYIFTLVNQLAFQGKEVLISGLTTTSEGAPFGHIGDMMCIADEIILKKAYCACCGSDGAQFTYRLVKSKEQDLIGDYKEYEPRCRECMAKTMGV